MAMKTHTAAGGVNGVLPTTSDVGSGDAWNAVVTTGDGSGAGGNPVNRYSTAFPWLKSIVYEFALRANVLANYLEDDNGSDLTTSNGRFYFGFNESTVSASVRLMVLRQSAAGGNMASALITTGKKLRVGNHDGSAAVPDAGPTLAHNTRYRLEWTFTIGSGTSHTLRLYLFEGDSTTAVYDTGNVTVTSSVSAAAFRLARYGTVTPGSNQPSATGSIAEVDIVSFSPTLPGPAATSQQLVPDQDIQNPGGFTRGGIDSGFLFSQLDETTLDTGDYVESPGITSTPVSFRNRLTAGTDPGAGVLEQAYWTIGKDLAGGDAITAVLRLYEGTTLKRTWTRPLPDTATTYFETIDVAVDETQLRLEPEFVRT